ncbi:HIR complex subunit [Fusarium torreyae]|uniref:HIR complex subunit n=1 Tax=Fusarium torreyae TaxID=1237075 RepID=A0A9W8VAZ8_9HYPO|nr:HIR complex subunit [Fusarium torreyae]
MAATAGDTSMSRYDSSAGELSSPPSGSLSEPGSPSRNGSNSRAPQEYDEIVVVNSDGQYQHIGHQSNQGRPPPPLPPQSGTGPPKRYALVENQWVQLTAAGVPRKKPGRKPGTIVKPRNSDGADAAKAARKPRKPRDPNAPPLPRKRKIAPADGEGELPADSKSLAAAAASSTPGPLSDVSNIAASPPAQHHRQTPSSSHQTEQRYSPKIPKREHFGSMQSLLNSDPPVERPQSQPQSQPNSSTTIPVRTSGQSYDPIRGNYDPIRETMVSHNSYNSASGSPRAPSQMPNRSPTIASLLGGSESRSSYQPPSNQPRFQTQEPSQPSSPSKEPQTISTPTPSSRPSVQEAKKDLPPPPPPVQRPVIKESNFTTISNGPIKKTSPKQKPHTGVSTPKTDNLDDMQEGEGRSILDFGRAKPGEEAQAPTIILSVPIQAGETNKYVNFMRMAEDRYGWDALHPRLAANRDRKARIAAAAASLEKAESGRESGDEMSVDLSDAEASNPDNGATSGPDAQAKPKKKRNFKEDQYDVDDDFVDDSELLWEAQAAASRDGFFVYSGPLVPEVEKPAAGQEGPPKRGRGGRGSRGGARGASTRGGTGSGRGGGPGSRGGSVTRKPRITKQEKAQREREKAERENMAQLAKTPTHGYSLNPTTPSFAVSELGA